MILVLIMILEGFIKFENDLVLGKWELKKL